MFEPLYVWMALGLIAFIVEMFTGTFYLAAIGAAFFEAASITVLTDSLFAQLLFATVAVIANVFLVNRLKPILQKPKDEALISIVKAQRK